MLGGRSSCCSDGSSNISHLLLLLPFAFSLPECLEGSALTLQIIALCTACSFSCRTLSLLTLLSENPACLTLTKLCLLFCLPFRQA